jgi:hypothetical protein
MFAPLASFAPFCSRLCLLCSLCFLLFILFILFLLPSVGCTSSKLTPVSGTITLDGQPLTEGTIQFAPSAGDAPSQAAVIQAGKFSTELHRTTYKIRIHAPKPSRAVAKLDENGPGGGPRVEELLPPRYNTQSELTLNVTGPTTAADFALHSK